MTTLVVAELYPWPANDGYRIRLDNIVRGLATVDEVEVVALHRPGDPEPERPDIPGVTRILSPHSRGERGPRDWMAPWLRGREPRRLLGGLWDGVTDEVAAWLSDRYDLVWYSHVDSWWPVHHLLPGVPAIVDFDNLENLALRLRRRLPPEPATGGIRPRVEATGRWAVSRAFDLVDERRWDAMQRAASAAARHVVVCSPLDVGRSECPNAVCIPNGYEPTAEADADRRPLRGDAPTFNFVGFLSYEPNTDAVSWFVDEVWPLVRRELPDARVRIVGRGEEAVARVGSVPGVDLVGAVPDLKPELELADVSIVPIRFGAGTRLKVVEAMANRLPVVSTTVGCEGIGVEDGVSGLVADGAADFAAACVRVARDGDLRQRLADGGAALFESGYRWSAIHERVGGLATASRRPTAP